MHIFIRNNIVGECQTLLINEQINETKRFVFTLIRSIHETIKHKPFVYIIYLNSSFVRYFLKQAEQLIQQLARELIHFT